MRFLPFLRNYFGDFHIVKNFPRDYSPGRKLYVHLFYLACSFQPRPRANWLNIPDLDEVRKTLEPGDILLMGNLRTMLSKFCGGAPITHSGIYTGQESMIHSMCDGVTHKSLEEVLSEYDSLAALRIPKQISGRDVIIEKALRLAEAQRETPYDFFFTDREDAFFCSRFVNTVLNQAGYATNLRSIDQHPPQKQFAPPLLKRARSSLQPIDFVQCLDLVYHSPNLCVHQGKLTLRSLPGD